MTGATMTLPSQSAGHFVYIKTERDPDLWTVGFYDRDGKFVPESDHSEQHLAAARVHFLHGGAPDLLAENSKLKGQLEEAVRALEMIRDQTYVDAEGPELRAQNECNHRRAIEALSKRKEAGS